MPVSRVHRRWGLNLQFTINPNGSCLFAAGLPTYIVGSQNFQTFSTRQTAHLGDWWGEPTTTWGLHHLPPHEFGGREELLYIEGFNGFCPLAGVWFPGYMKHPPAATPRPSWVLPRHVVCHWHSTVGWLVGPVWIYGTACRANVQHPDYLAPNLVDHNRTCIASLWADEGCQLGDVWR